jgi:hypothetical protein
MESAMKENVLGPRQWAFVVITGGAACALPFLQTDNSPTKIDSAPTSSQQDALLVDRYAPAGSPLRSGPPIAAGAAADPAVPLSVPEWANANRSPFDDLVGNTAVAPEASPPKPQLPMQPLRPWIVGPGDSSTLVATGGQSRQPARTNAPGDAIASRDPSTRAASPWSEEPTGFTPIEQLDSHPSTVASALVHQSNPRSNPQSDRWPDQAVSADELARATRSRDHELASAIVPPPQSQQQTLSTVPVAAQRFGQAYLPPDSPSANSALQAAATSTAPNPSNLPSLPDSRKSHIIFQPGTGR